MTEDEIIIFECESDKRFTEISHEALFYALISFPFTVNRMNLRNARNRIINIYKGKIAEGLLEDFAEQTGLKFDFEGGKTGFWERDKFDFEFRGTEWDQKNNFIRSGSKITPGSLLKLPALVPNRFEEDQWGQFQNSETKKGFVFSFIASDDFPSLKAFKLSGAQLDFIQSINETTNKIDEEPFKEEWFKAELEKRGSAPKILHDEIPKLYITAYCDKPCSERFMDTDSFENFNYAMYTGKWYEVEGGRRLNFCNGMLKTRIKNATCPIEALPSFRSVI